MYTINDDRVVMSVNGLKAAFHMPSALLPKYKRKNGDGTWHPKDGDDAKGEEIIQGLPPGAPRFVFPVDEYQGCPSNWMHGSAKASSYWLPVRDGCGMWLDLNYNFGHSHHVACVVSVQGINPITGQQTKKLRLEQYRERCPIHDIPFGQDRFCEQCNYKWDAQNYVSTNCTPKGLLWIDGFRAADGVVRQYVFTKETCKGVAAQIIGDERVFAIGIAFYLSKKPKVEAPIAPELTPHKYKDDIATFKRIPIPLKKRHFSNLSNPYVPNQEQFGIRLHDTNDFVDLSKDIAKGGVVKDQQGSGITQSDAVPDIRFGPRLAGLSRESTIPGVIPPAGPIPDKINFGSAANILSKIELTSGSTPSEIPDKINFGSAANIPSKIGLTFPADDALSLQQLASGDANLDKWHAPSNQEDCWMPVKDSMLSKPIVVSEHLKSAAPPPPKGAIAPGEKLSPADIDGELREKSPEEIEQEMEKLEISAGARIKQLIYVDPEEPDFWQDEPCGFIYINYCSITDAEKIMAAGKREMAGSFLSALSGM